MLERIIKTVGSLYGYGIGLHCIPDALNMVINKDAHKTIYNTGLVILAIAWSVGEYKLIKHIWRDNEDTAVKPLGLASTEAHTPSKETSITVG